MTVKKYKVTPLFCSKWDPYKLSQQPSQFTSEIRPVLDMSFLFMGKKPKVEENACVYAGQCNHKYRSVQVASYEESLCEYTSVL